MKRKLLLLTTLIAYCTTGFAQNKDIETIRKHFYWINNQKNYTTITLHNQDFVDFAADAEFEATAYFLNDKIYKITETADITDSKEQTDYYFWNDTLFFVYIRDFRYPFNQDTYETDYSKPEVTAEKRFYFKNNKLIKAIYKPPLTDENAEEQKNDIDDLQTFAEKILLYAYIYKSHKDFYDKIQGVWISADDPSYTIKINGLVQDEYYDGDYQGTYRILFFNDDYLYSYSIDQEEQTETKYKIEKITPDKLELLYLPKGTELKFVRK